MTIESNNITCSDLYEDYIEKHKTDFSTKLLHSLNVLNECLHRYDPSQITVGFNGGKDCTLVLNLYSYVLKRRYSSSSSPPKLRALFIRNHQQFEVMDSFIHDCVQKYNIDLITIDGRFREALSKLKVIDPQIQCVIMGSRKTDPNSSTLNDFSPTDSDWPSYMRCNPILHYTYKDVWTFLRLFQISYCSIYDEGFTSLGNKDVTVKNIKLKYQTENGVEQYKPAYMLDDEVSERDGRI
ncbi:unnamed protein product [Didymodactylos carnosus]|uniref:FAD synthase n=1 Tax=Didymodactylos carnosus TaxID=1234261 RepID=A0A813WQV8_9BILA|nr:unnamed protein product [Didymodactylos carnosus]CAF0858502.1 unnamed protein product [Didymodactylos carnosus]CAF3600162.1 unnamed protein product [Didymodactylos carnosus]CAF3646166.1 unnamed protein product [Didymodactylos carnosus]